MPSTVEWVQELRKLKALLQERELLLSNLSKTEHELVEVRLLIHSGCKAPLRVHRIGMQQGCKNKRPPAHTVTQIRSGAHAHHTLWDDCLPQESRIKTDQMRRRFDADATRLIQELKETDCPG